MEVINGIYEYCDSLTSDRSMHVSWMQFKRHSLDGLRYHGISLELTILWLFQVLLDLLITIEVMQW